MKKILTIITIMIISITGYSQINVHNVVPSYAVPYFQANIRIKDTIQTKTLLAIDGAVLFSGTTGATPASGAGTRLMWIPSKAAFRAGYVDGTQWDDSLVGSYSTAMGVRTTASGDISTAMGVNTTASGWASTALGSETTASGEASTAMGAETTASGEASTAMGVNTTASGDISTAMGVRTTASGWASTAMGVRTTASGDISTAMGVNTTANSYALFTAGRFNDTTSSTSKDSWVSTDPLFQIGNGLGDDTRNDAFRILKNGKTFIGDSSSTTDAILIVDPTDSTVTQLGMVKRTYVLTVNDDANLVLPDDFAGWVEVSALNSGTEDEYASFRINSDGTIAGLTFNTANVTLVLGTDGNLNIGTTSTKGVIENKLGGSRDFIVRIEGKLYLGM